MTDGACAKLPSRRELRLARQREEEVLNQGRQQAAQRLSREVTQEVETQTLLAVSTVREKAASTKATLMRTWLAAATAAGMAFGIGIAAIQSSSANSAFASAGTTSAKAASLMPTSDQSTPDTPQTLRSQEGAADSARFNDASTVFDSQPFACRDLGANSLSAAFVDESSIVVMPMKAGTYHISSPYGPRSDPFRHEPSFHSGVDFAGKAGTPIYAIADGTVVYAGEGLWGRSSNVVVIEHDIKGVKYHSWYVHMYEDGVHVKTGDKVSVGQHIADVGSNGKSTGPHLHFEIHPGTFDIDNAKDDVTISPLPTLESLKAADVSDICG